MQVCLLVPKKNAKQSNAHNYIGLHQSNASDDSLHLTGTGGSR